MTPFRGTGWAAGRPPPGHGAAQYTGAQAQPNYNNQANYNQQPAYAPPQNSNYYGNGGANQSYFGGQQSGVELQQPNSSYQPQRGGDQVYSPPSGPPPVSSLSNVLWACNIGGNAGENYMESGFFLSLA
ncbi:MAG: hypothetical protein Q9169_001907 [Polycauliona sp. 2 TL-2023]